MNSKRYQYEQAQQRSQAERMKVGQLVKVLSYNASNGTVDVQPLTKRRADGSYHVPPPILAVPVASHRGGNFTMSHGYSPGDTGYITYVDGDIDSTLAAGRETQPNTGRVHSATDAVFVGGVSMGGGPVNSLPGGSQGMGTIDGSAFVVWVDGKWKIKGDVEIEGNVTVKGNLTIEGDLDASGGLNVGSDASVGGNLNVAGSLDVSGDIAAGGTITPWPEV